MHAFGFCEDISRFFYIFSDIIRPLFSHPSPGNYDLNKIESILPDDVSKSFSFSG